MRRIWFYRPQLYWFGWKTLIPVYFGALSDDGGRRTVVFGWTITGRVIVAYRTCRCEYCDEMREQTARFEAGETL